MVSLIIPVYQSTCILGVCVNQYGCLRVTPVKARVSSHTSIPVTPVHQSHQYTSLPVYQSLSSDAVTSTPVTPVYQPASIPVIVTNRSYQYTSHTSIPVAVIPTLPLWMSVPYESTPLAAVCEESSPLAAVIVLDHICTHRPCTYRASRTSIFHLV